MAQRCMITGKGVMSGNNVSHANNRTRRRFMPNLQRTKLLSDTLGIMVPVRLTTSAIRTIEHKGGLDAYLLGTANTKLHPDLRKVKKRLVEAREATPA